MCRNNSRKRAMKNELSFVKSDGKRNVFSEYKSKQMKERENTYTSARVPISMVCKSESNHYTFCFIVVAVPLL